MLARYTPAPVPIHIGDPQFMQPVPLNNDKSTNTEYPTLDQWLECSEKDDAVYAQAYSAFRPFEEDAGSPPSSSASESGSSSSPTITNSTPSSGVMDAEGFAAVASLPKQTTQRKSAPKLSLPTPAPLSETHTANVDAHGRVQPFQETSPERIGRQEFVKQQEYSRRLALAGLETPGLCSDEFGWGVSGGRVEEEVQSAQATTVTQHRRRRHRASRPRPTPAQRDTAARTIQRAFRAYLDREAVITTIVQEIECVVIELRDAFLAECEDSHTKLPSPHLLQLYLTALTALALRLSCYTASLPPHIAHHPSVVEERETIQDILANERIRAERLTVSTKMFAMRRRLRKAMEKGGRMGVLLEEEE